MIFQMYWFIQTSMTNKGYNGQAFYNKMEYYEKNYKGIDCNSRLCLRKNIILNMPWSICIKQKKQISI